MIQHAALLVVAAGIAVASCACVYRSMSSSRKIDAALRPSCWLHRHVIDGNVDALKRELERCRRQRWLEVRCGCRVFPAALDNATSLMIAAWRGDLEAVRVLLEFGANVDAGNPAYTPLMLACLYEGSEERATAVARLLLSYGANPRAWNGLDSTDALECAMARHRRELADLIVFASDAPEKNALPTAPEAPLVNLAAASRP
jgi:hypothetical protein